jgi:hypothetical protein
VRNTALSQAVIAAAVTGLVAATRRRTSASRAPQRRLTDPYPESVVPAQRRSGLALLGLDEADDVVVAEHEAQDDRMFQALDWRTTA